MLMYARFLSDQGISFMFNPFSVSVRVFAFSQYKTGESKSSTKLFGEQKFESRIRRGLKGE